ncbi:hypothetical protein [Kineosporia sp. NBRC 101731]|uniref:hypothetical protein n=1 Tax=Kineosporia sp. NBRC 101731 TaxID=3032199 RepID=UPI0024A55F70|nr:hypothetical protein [Kineosporia sp. NBRC 101731]GLY28095.1 hypothetical protein Kisp02_14600 [Kineosporia sp. NBRC 101731]
MAGVGIPVSFLVLEGSPPGAPPSLVPITLIILVVAVSRLATIIYTGDLRIVSIVSWMMIYISGAVVPLAQAHASLWPVTINIEFLPEAQLMILAWAIAFEVGQHLRSRERRVFDVTQAKPISLSRLKSLTIIASIITLAYIAKLGPASFFQSRADLAIAMNDSGIRGGGSQVTSAFFSMGATVPVFICLVTWIVITYKKPEKRSAGMKLLKLWLLALNVIVNNPISSSRFWALTIFIGFAFAMPWFKARTMRFIIPAGIITALVLFPYSDYFRGQEGQIQVVGVVEKISTKDYDQSTMTANGIWYGERYGHTHGRQILGAVLFAVPRTLWPGKPLDTGVMVGQAASEQIYVGTTNLSSPAWVEAWIDFGMPGVIIIGAAVGWLARRADEMFMAARASGRVTVIAVSLPMFAGFSFILLRGPLLQSMGRVAGMALVAWWLADRKLMSKGDPAVDGEAKESSDAALTGVSR